MQKEELIKRLFESKAITFEEMVLLLSNNKTEYIYVPTYPTYPSIYNPIYTPSTYNPPLFPYTVTY